MKKLIFLTLLFVGFSAFAQESYVSLDQSYERKYMTDFIKIANSSKDLGDFILRLGTLRDDDAVFLKRHFDLRKPLPKMTYRDSTLSFSDGTTLKIIDLKSHSFRINGRNIRYENDKSMAENLVLIDKKLRERQSAKYLWPLGFIQNLFAAKKAKEEKEEPDEDLDKTELFYNNNEKFYKDPMSLSENANFGWFLVSPVMAVDYAVVKADSALSPSCDKQVSELNALLEESKLALKTSYCGSTYRGFDRKMTFWTPTAKGKPAEEKSYDLDFRTQTLRETNSNKMLFFGKDELEEVRELKTTKDGRIERLDYKQDSGEFKKTKKDIEPLRKILYYIGNNRTCEKCAKELRSRVATEKAPAYLSGAAANSSSNSGSRGNSK